jgi:hypothetical protein
MYNFIIRWGHPKKTVFPHKQIVDRVVGIIETVAVLGPYKGGRVGR